MTPWEGHATLLCLAGEPGGVRSAGGGAGATEALGRLAPADVEMGPAVCTCRAWRMSVRTSNPAIASGIASAWISPSAKPAAPSVELPKPKMGCESCWLLTCDEALARWPCVVVVVVEVLEDGQNKTNSHSPRYLHYKR